MHVVSCEAGRQTGLPAPERPKRAGKAHGHDRIASGGSAAVRIATWTQAAQGIQLQRSGMLACRSRTCWGVAVVWGGGAAAAVDVTCRFRRRPASVPRRCRCCPVGTPAGSEDGKGGEEEVAVGVRDKRRRRSCIDSAVIDAIRICRWRCRFPRGEGEPCALGIRPAAWPSEHGMEYMLSALNFEACYRKRIRRARSVRPRTDVDARQHPSLGSRVPLRSMFFRSLGPGIGSLSSSLQN
ncbi:hypothetical protein GQ55_1G369200 [Panicum hallii var. hallii]|uniref:Uncharacterized protein n=1 Tax=Panicum hallii var. hallii TaxID=1504633 RepID=A0A2T7FBG6_9POAL|nr:hypothetical protein GQ55_1G369200 [Panicum hallii var. hallii]